CPGLVDAHVHVTANPVEIGLKVTYKNISSSMNYYKTAFLVRGMLLGGFATERDFGGANAALKEAISKWLIPGPWLVISGHAISQTRGHGSQKDSHDDGPTTTCCGGHNSGIGHLCDGTDACITVVRVLSKFNNLAHSQFLQEEITAITWTAELFDTYVNAHTYSNRRMQHMVENGAVGIEHSNFLDGDTAQFLVERNV
ncbi:hypothetical protein BJ878DRAFT_424876, partial [Calycina marina]